MAQAMHNEIERAILYGDQKLKPRRDFEREMRAQYHTSLGLGKSFQRDKASGVNKRTLGFRNRFTMEAIVIFEDKDSRGSSRAPHVPTALVRLGEVKSMPGVVRYLLAVCRHNLLPLEDVHRASITKLEIVYVAERADSRTMTLRVVTSH